MAQLETKFTSPAGALITAFVLNRPAPRNGQEQKYSAVIAVPKGKDDGRIKELMESLKKLAVDSGFTGDPNRLHLPIQDGDDEILEALASGGQANQYYANSWIIKARTQFAPGVYIREEDGSMNAATDPAQIYRGCQAVLACQCVYYPTTPVATAGITARLQGVLKVGEGERIVGKGRSPFELFEGF